MTVEAVMDSDVTQANTASEKKQMLRSGSFHRHDHDQYYKRPQAGRAHTCVTKSAVERAADSQSVKKPRAQTRCLFTLYGYSGHGINRE
jgi:hypothetical protein